jgi:Rubisco LSMT substrate-binding
MMQDTLSNEGDIAPLQKTEELQNKVFEIFARRMKEYGTSLEEDEGLLRQEGGLGLRKRMALEVRVSEKRILMKARERIEGWVISPPTKRQRQK